MKLIIDIPEEEYERFGYEYGEENLISKHTNEIILDAFCNGTPLEQEPKTGRWIKSSIGGAKICSICQAHMGLSSFKFCPNCGCRMVDPQESEE